MSDTVLLSILLSVLSKAADAIFRLQRIIQATLPFASVVPRGNSAQAARFAALVQTILPGKIEQVLTANGSEFQGAFDQYLRQRKIRHCYTYPKCLKMNAYNERFNRTIREEFIGYREALLLEDIGEFNRQIIDYLQRYNDERSHRGLNYMTPYQVIARQLPHLSGMYWTRTCASK